MTTQPTKTSGEVRDAIARSLRAQGVVGPALIGLELQQSGRGLYVQLVVRCLVALVLAVVLYALGLRGRLAPAVCLSLGTVLNVWGAWSAGRLYEVRRFRAQTNDFLRKTPAAIAASSPRKTERP